MSCNELDAVWDTINRKLELSCIPSFQVSLLHTILFDTFCNIIIYCRVVIVEENLIGLNKLIICFLSLVINYSLTEMFFYSFIHYDYDLCDSSYVWPVADPGFLTGGGGPGGGDWLKNNKAG